MSKDLGLSPREIKKLAWNQYMESGWEDQEVFQKMLAKNFGGIDWRVLANGVVAYRRAKQENLKPFPGVKKTLAALKRKGLKLGVVSDAPRQFAWIRLVDLGLDSFFDFVLAHEDTMQKKPHPVPFKAALKRLGLKPWQVLFVGDSISRDMRGAKSVGMKTALAVYGRTLKRAPAKTDYRLKRFSDLAKTIR